MTPAGFLLKDGLRLFPWLSLDGGSGYIDFSATVSLSTSWRQQCGTNTLEGINPTLVYSDTAVRVDLSQLIQK